jgi:acyl-CoA reductase-like NAD-dependent aldehyde dehydrogenase
MVKLLELPYDHIFFTGSGNVGRIVAAAAAKHLCPVTLELGGKSPVVVLDDADIANAAKRIIWGKHVNAAQTCIAPDYVLCSKALQPKLIEGMRVALKGFYPKGNGPLNSATYSNMVNVQAYERLTGAVSETKGQIVIGGGNSEGRRQIDITVVADVPLDDSLMTHELFGPVLPIVPCESKEQAVELINQRYDLSDCACEIC